MWRKSSLQMDLSRLQKVSSKSESEPKSFSGPSSPREQMLLEDDAVAGEGPAYSVSVYGMSILAVVRSAKVWFAVSKSLFTQLKIAETEDALLSTWPDAFVQKTSSVEGHSYLLTRAGLLRLIAHSSSPKAIDILNTVASGLVQFDAAARVCILAEQARRADVLQEQSQHKERIEAEMKEWSASKLAKQQRRREKRSSTSPAPVRTQNPEEEAKEDSKKDALHLSRPKSVFRKMVREGSDKRLKEIVMQREVFETLRSNRRKANEASIAPLPDKPIEGDPTEVVVDESASYIQNDQTRVMKNVAAPTEVVLGMSQVFSGKNDSPAMRLLAKHFSREGRIDQAAARKLLRDCCAILKEEPNCLEIEAPCHIFGDIHGQFFDFLQIINKCGSPVETKQLWLGDYVDRGSFGCEVVLMLAAAKIKWPKHIFLLRGNHESRSMAHRYNFESEALQKYSMAFEDFMTLFDALPLAAVVSSAQGRFFCVHGGLSPMIRSPLDLERLERFEEPPHWGPTCDLLWSDPMDESHAKDSKFLEEYFSDNLDRGCGQLFGPAAVKDFLTDNEMVCVIRAHEVQKEGWKEQRFFHPDLPVPMVMTVFSAPNYCGRYENKGAFLTIFDSAPQRTPKVSQIGWADEPFNIPANKGNILQAAMPLLAEAIVGFFLAVLEVFQDEVDDEPLPGDDLLDPEEEKIATTKFDQSVERVAGQLASLRVERKEFLASLAPAAINSDSSDEVFSKIADLDAKTEMRGK